jgi:hypothetical protein
MVDEGIDRQLCQHRFQAAQMIAVIMGDDQVIELRDAQRRGSGGDAVGIHWRGKGRLAGKVALAARAWRKAGVDQHRFAFGRAKQYGGAPFGIDRDDPQILRRFGRFGFGVGR